MLKYYKYVTGIFLFVSWCVFNYTLFYVKSKMMTSFISLKRGVWRFIYLCENWSENNSTFTFQFVCFDLFYKYVTDNTSLWNEKL